MQRKHVLGAVATILLGVTAAPTSAEEQSPAQSAEKATHPAASKEGNVAEVVVTGVRRSLENAINTKRNADTVVDAISAEDVGKFPTENVAESLQRVTGVQISRYRGEGQNVTIRGLPTDFTLVQLNGHQLTSALGPTSAGFNRSFDFAILPAEFVSSIEVHKAPTADLEEGGLAGTVVARTARPLDIGRRKLAGTFQAANESNRDKWEPRASLFYTDVFADDRLGLALGAAYTRKLTETHEQRIPRYRRITEVADGGIDLNGNGIIEDGKGGRPLNPTTYAIMDSDFHTIDREDHKRKTVMATVQARPNENWDFNVDGFYSKINIYAPSSSDLMRLGVGVTKGFIVPGSVVVTQRPGNAALDHGQPVNLVESMELRGVDERGDGRLEMRDGDLLEASLGGAWHADGIKVSTELTHSRATQVRSNPLEEDTRSGDVLYDLRTNHDLVSITRPGTENTARLDPATFSLLTFNGEWNRHREDQSDDVSIDVDKDVKWGWFDSLRVGTRAAERKVHEDNRRITGTPAQLAPLWNNASQPPPEDLFLVTLRPSTGSFLGAEGNTSGLFPQNWLANDPAAFMNAFGRERIESLSTITNDPAGSTNVKERTYALYFRANIGRAESKLSGNLGVRVVRTEQTAIGVSPDLNGITFDGSTTRVPAAGMRTVEHNYFDALPSLNLKYELTDDLLLRLAASRTLSRPTLAQISPTVTANGTTQILTSQNPLLNPFRSNNLDLAGEWYFTEGGLLATTLFYKDIISRIVPFQTTIPLTINQINPDGSTTRVDQTWTLNTQMNGPGASVTGAEIAYQQNLTFLPSPFDGLGFLGNYTYMQSHGGSVPLSGASKNNYTATLYYEKGRIGGRVAYTYRGKYYISTDGTSKDDAIEQPYGTLDANLTYNVTDHLSFVLEGTNLLEDTDSSRWMPIDRPNNFSDNGRRVLVGARASF